MSDDREIVGGEAGAHGGLVFVELDVEAPAKSIHYFPVAAHRTGNACGVGWQGTDVVAPLAAGLGLDGSFSLNDGETPQIHPLLGLVEPIEGVECPTAVHFTPPMAIIGSFARGTGHELAADAGLREQESFDELGVVVFHAQHVVGTAIADLPRDAGLSAHRADGDDAALQRQQLGGRRNLVRLLGRRSLPQHETDVGSEGADQV